MAKKKKPEGYVFGRPTLYKPQYVQEIIEHFDKPLYQKKIKIVQRMGVAVEVEVEVPNSFPTFEGFATKIRTTHRTLVTWTEKHPDFLHAYALCKGIQKSFLIEHGLIGGYNPGFAKFLAINVSDLKDVQERPEENQPIHIVVNGNKS